MIQTGTRTCLKCEGKFVWQQVAWNRAILSESLHTGANDPPVNPNNNTQPDQKSTLPLNVSMMGRQEHEFSVSRARDWSNKITELNETHHQYTSDSNPPGSHPAADVHVEVYDCSGSVSLSSCMQSNVPQPFSPQNKAPSHMHMPQGGLLRLDKYLYHNVQKTHQTRNFVTSACFNSQGDQDVRPREFYEEPNIQGIQGNHDNSCAVFKEWLDNCSNHIVNAKSDLEQVKSGQKTLAQVFADCEKIPSSSAVNIWYDVPCPQGIQGTDCAQFQLWLENCIKLGHEDCIQQVEHIKSGKKTLSQIFAEQEKSIHRVALLYTQGGFQRRGFSTSAKTDQGEQQLSQKERLKKAVKEYGATVIVFHVTISLASLGGFYLAVSSGLDVAKLLSKIGVEGSTIAAGASTFVMAYAVHKVFAPVRIAITLTATPLIVRYLRSIGFLKQPVKTIIEASKK